MFSSHLCHYLFLHLNISVPLKITHQYTPEEVLDSQLINKGEGEIHRVVNATPVLTVLFLRLWNSVKPHYPLTL